MENKNMKIKTNIGIINIEEVQTGPDDQTIKIMAFKETGKWYTDIYANLPIKVSELTYDTATKLREGLEQRNFLIGCTLVVMRVVPYII